MKPKSQPPPEFWRLARRMIALGQLLPRDPLDIPELEDPAGRAEVRIVLDEFKKTEAQLHALLDEARAERLTREAAAKAKRLKQK